MVLDIRDPGCDVELLFRRFVGYVRLRRFCFDDFVVWLRYELSLQFPHGFLDLMWCEPSNEAVFPIIEAWVSCGLVRVVTSGGDNVHEFWWDVV